MVATIIKTMDASATRRDVRNLILLDRVVGRRTTPPAQCLSRRAASEGENRAGVQPAEGGGILPSLECYVKQSIE